MNTKTHVLLVEDSPSLATLYQEYIHQENCSATVAHSGKEALLFLERKIPEIIVLDVKLPDMTGVDILKTIHENKIDTRVIMITAHGSVDIAVDAMRYGAFDFIEKPFNSKRLGVTLRNAIEQHRLQNILSDYKSQFSKDNFYGFIGSSVQMQSVYRIIENTASSKATVFITGESGTGKEVCARAVHDAGSRNKEPFVAINCAAIPRELMESEIFGHNKGAFTGATSSRDGAAARADKGTLFLDEICEMDLDLQSKLLRFIQTGSYMKVGGTSEQHTNIRFVCATNRDPWEEVKAGRFREDLFYRLHVIPIELPALRDRDDDVIDISNEFLHMYNKEENKSFTKFSDDVLQIIREYEWPGNIRQLQNIIRNIVVLHDAEKVNTDMLPPPLNQQTEKSDVVNVNFNVTEISEPVYSSVEAEQHSQIYDEEKIVPLWLQEKYIIESAIDKCKGNIPKAAVLLEISPSTIYRKKQSWETRAS